MTILTQRGAELEQRPHFVYTLLDAAGGALYVGLSVNVARRILLHHKTLRASPGSTKKPATWLLDARDLDMSGPYRRSVGLKVERDLIERLQPRGNVQYTARDHRPWIAETSAGREVTS